MAKLIVNVCTEGNLRKPQCRLRILVVGSILGGLLSLSTAASAQPKTLSTESGIVAGVRQSIEGKRNVKKRRDPFQPMNHHRRISPSSRKSHTTQPTTLLVPKTNLPDWKVLGIVHGLYGCQAVIRVSQQERVFVRPGFEVVRSGWIVKAISQAEVLLEHTSTLGPGKRQIPSKTFILSVQTPRTSS